MEDRGGRAYPALTNQRFVAPPAADCGAPGRNSFSRLDLPAWAPGRPGADGEGFHFLRAAFFLDIILGVV